MHNTGKKRFLLSPLQITIVFLKLITYIINYFGFGNFIDSFPSLSSRIPSRDDPDEELSIFLIRLNNKYYFLILNSLLK